MNITYSNLSTSQVGENINENPFSDIDVEDQKEISGVGSVLLGIVLGIINILILIGNTLVLLCVILRNQQSHLRKGQCHNQRRTNIFIVNLALTDLTLSLLVLPLNIVQIIAGRWVLGNTCLWCLFGEFVDVAWLFFGW